LAAKDEHRILPSIRDDGKALDKMAGHFARRQAVQRSVASRVSDGDIQRSRNAVDTAPHQLSEHYEQMINDFVDPEMPQLEGIIEADLVNTAARG
jgi:hypothetical protein